MIYSLESIQYNATVAITGAIKGTFKEKLFNDLDIENLIDKQWMQRLSHKIFNLKSPKYLHDLIPSVTSFYATRNNTNVSSFNCRTEHFMSCFFPNVINECNKLNIKITNMTSEMPLKILY